MSSAAPRSRKPHRLVRAKRRPARTASAIDETRPVTARTTPVAARNGKAFTVVGIGASAGGLDAFTRLLKRLPANTGLGFVLVQHLDPQHESALTAILSRATSMPVCEATNNLRVEPDHVYVIPPNTELRLVRGALKLQRRGVSRMPAHSIDAFLQSLAQDQHEHTIGVILSGNATDGTIGLEAIKAEGGITFAQDDTAAYDSMPRSAINAGCADFVLSPEEIAEELVRIAAYAATARDMNGLSISPDSLAKSSAVRDQLPLPSRGRRMLRLPKKTGKSLSPGEARDFAKTGDVGDGYGKILLHLRNHTGVDFSHYKSPTIRRRIARRMILNRHQTIESYADFLRGNTKELDALYSDSLISVTSFFRNAEAFDILRYKVFPKLLQQESDEPVRIWVLGCSTGQEAYSLAMAFTEAAEKISRARQLQVFATDLNDANLEKARHGLYAKSVAQDVSPERLRRFFTEEGNGYRVIKPLRELVVFARQNILSDPPFSRMDLISCRNLMIYLEPGLQQKALPTFHYALKPAGFLFLGASESIGSCTDLFEPVDKKQKIFSKKAAKREFLLPLKKDRDLRTLPRPIPRLPLQWNKMLAVPEAFRHELTAEREADRVAAGKYAPPGVLINEALQILQFRGSTGAYLEPATGKASFNLLKMAREGLILPLRSTINQAKKENKTIRRENVSVVENGRSRRVTIEIVPLRNLKERCFLVLFVKGEKLDSGSAVIPHSPAATKGATSLSRKAESKRVALLERDLTETREYLQSVQGEYEAAADEIQSAHEEGQSANEELQSLNEELETSKEELESTNEELITVNEEMTNRNRELTRLNSDLTNLQNSTKLAIVLLGMDLTVRRFSVQAAKQFNLQPGDLGRPFNGIRHEFELPNLVTDVAEVIASMQEREREVADRQGRCHMLHLYPYLGPDNKADGAVLVLVDITAVKDSEQEVVRGRDFADAIINTARDPFLILDSDFRVKKANQAFFTVFKGTPEETLERTLFELNRGQWDLPALRKLLSDILPRHSFFNDFEATLEFEHIGRRTMLLNARTLIQAPGHHEKILLGLQDISELLQFQAQLRHSELRYRRLFEAGKDGVLIINPLTRRIIDANPFMSELLGYSHAALVGKELFEIGLLKDEEASQLAFQELQKSGFIRYDDLPLPTKTGLRREVEFVSNLYQEGGGQVVQCNIRDITVRRRTERELSEKARLLDLSSDAVVVCDLDDRIRLWNKGAERLYGWKFEEVIGKACLAVLQTEFPEPQEKIYAQLRQEGDFSGEVVQIARDGHRVPSLCRWVLDVGTQSILASYTDITAQKAAAVEITRERDKAIAASRAKDDFLAALSHELRTPLNPVLLTATDGASDASLPESAREAFNVIVKNVLLEARLIDDLLDLTKITHGKMILEMQRVDLHSVLQDAIKTMGTDFEQKKLLLTWELTRFPHCVIGDPVRLQQVLWNVLKNALKFTSPGGTVHVSTQVNQANTDVILVVTDSGIGMTPAELQRVFVAFAQGDHTTNESLHRFGGLGLGLMISRMLVQLHSGQISASSPGRDQGTTITVTLPLAPPEKIPRSLVDSSPSNPPLPISVRLPVGQRILLVEDHEATRKSLADLLTRRGHKIATAGSVAQARAHAQSEQFDLIISDIGLPDGDGCVLMAELQSRFGLKGIAMTGYGMEQDVARTRSAGFLTHLTKPIGIQNLEAAIEAATLATRDQVDGRGSPYFKPPLAIPGKEGYIAE